MRTRDSSATIRRSSPPCCIATSRGRETTRRCSSSMMPTDAPVARWGALITLELRYEHDVVLARQRARQIAELVGCDPQDQTRVATAVSELARNAFEYARGGRTTYSIDTANEPELLIEISDEGPG